MEIHHGKHHAAYVNNLNNAVKGHANLESKSATDLIKNLSSDSGGHSYSRPKQWRRPVESHPLLDPDDPGGSTVPTGKLADDIKAKFSSFDEFKAKFEEAGVKRFGSGWVWLVQKNGTLEIISTPNQDNPLMAEYDATPVLGNDVWEHAYYLHYQNRRPDYLKAWWNVVNWDLVAEAVRIGSPGSECHWGRLPLVLLNFP